MTAALTPFAITRLDGRSDPQVIIDLVKGSEPERIFRYDEFAAELARGVDKEYDVRATQAAVRRAEARLLKEEARALVNVREVGYRLAAAKDHRSIARCHERRARVQLRRGLRTLQHVRWEEMEPEARLAHEGMLMVVGSLYRNQQALDARLRKVEEVIRSVRQQSGDDP